MTVVDRNADSAYSAPAELVEVVSAADAFALQSDGCRAERDDASELK